MRVLAAATVYQGKDASNQHRTIDRMPWQERTEVAVEYARVSVHSKEDQRIRKRFKLRVDPTLESLSDLCAAR